MYIHIHIHIHVYTYIHKYIYIYIYIYTHAIPGRSGRCRPPKRPRPKRKRGVATPEARLLILSIH